jgi:hypothetical protein
MIYLSSRLRLHIDGHTEKFLLEAAPIRWYKEGSFRWRPHLNNSGVASDVSETEVNSGLDMSYFRGVFQPLDSIFPSSCSEIAVSTTDLSSDLQISSNIPRASTILGHPLQLPQAQFHISSSDSDDLPTASTEQSKPGRYHHWSMANWRKCCYCQREYDTRMWGRLVPTAATVIVNIVGFFEPNRPY